MRILLGSAAVLGLALGALCAHGLAAPAQLSPAKAAPVEFLYPEQITVDAGKPALVKLHFRVGEGLHINSHAPREEFLIPTTLEFPDGSGVKLENVDYPAGGEFAFPDDPKSKLSVYVGDHLVEAKLHYQACNNAQCLPPRTATVAVDVIAR